MLPLANIGTPEDWAREGGLVGLVLLALFVLIFLFVKIIQRKDSDHSGFIKTLLDDERNERKEAREETKKSMDGLATAIKELSDCLRK